MKLNKFALSVIASISMASASAYALTSDEEATILTNFESTVSTGFSVDALISEMSLLVSQYPSLAESITQIAVSQEPSATLNIVQAVAEQLQLAVNSGQITAEQSETILGNVEGTALQTASASGLTITADDITIASNAGTIDAFSANPTAAGVPNAPEPNNTPSVNAINRANRGTQVSQS